MALRFTDRFTAGVLPSGLYAQAAALALSGSIWSIYGATGTNQGLTMTREDGWLKATIATTASSNTLTRTAVLGAQLSSFLSMGASTNALIGVRLLAKEAVGVLVYLRTTLNSNITCTLFTSTDIPNYTAGVENYLEFQIDVANSVIHRWVDGVAIADLALPAASTTIGAAIVAGSAWVTFGPAQLGTTYTPNYTFWVKDFYCIEFTGVGDFETRLGPILLKGITVQAGNTDWTASSGSVTDALNTLVTDTASLTAPLVSSADSPSNLDLSLTADSFSGQVLGISFKGSAQRKGGIAAALESTVTTNGVTSAKSDVNLLSTLTYSNVLVSLAKTPNGKAWTKGLIESSKLTLLPVKTV